MIIPIIVLIVVGIVLMGMYNNMVKLRNRLEGAWSDINVQLKRRYDLIPNLVETVKGYAKHESETFEKVIQARNAATNVPSSSVAAQAQAEGMLTSALKQVMLVVENYPELKANTNYLQLQETLSSVEDDIQNSRRYYNAIVRDFNNAVETFPSLIVARMFNFNPYEYFEVAEGERENVKVKFD
ncbi:MAG: LemA family protein [Chitinophagales bacterium]